MTEKPDNRPAVEATLRALGDRLDLLDRRVADLARIEEGAALLSRRINMLIRRLERGDSRTAEVARQVADHEGALKMICVLLKQLDDPYGFGESLDEQIAREDGESMW
jgi:hypothetical protein